MATKLGQTNLTKMAKQLEFLEDQDILLATDWVRPLVPAPDSSTVNSFSTYGGTPVNNLGWVLAIDYFGERWIGETIQSIHMDIYGFGACFEAIRGTPLAGHVWDWRKEKQAMNLT